MNAKELRIGNYVFNENEILKIDYPKELDYSFNYGPIPLTKEWLINFNFVLDIGVGVWFHKKYSFTIWDRYSDVVNYKFSTSTIQSIEVITVHQLQNLFHAITGGELK